MARSTVLVTLLAFLPSLCWAWKPTTHQIEAVRGAELLDPSNPLRETLLSNERYLRAGSMGPDLWYPTLPSLRQYSDLAHYCETTRESRRRSGLRVIGV